MFLRIILDKNWKFFYGLLLDKIGSKIRLDDLLREKKPFQCISLVNSLFWSNIYKNFVLFVFRQMGLEIMIDNFLDRKQKPRLHLRSTISDEYYQMNILDLLSACEVFRLKLNNSRSKSDHKALRYPHLRSIKYILNPRILPCKRKGCNPQFFSPLIRLAA